MSNMKLPIILIEQNMAAKNCIGVFIFKAPLLPLPPTCSHALSDALK